jgi:ABC-2 type transport system permease protein
MPEDYMQSGRIRVYYWKDAPGEVARGAFETFVRTSLAADLPQEVRARVLEGVSLTVRSADGRREVSTRNIADFVLPFAAGFFFVMAVMTSAGYLLQAVTTEKENRTMEVMVTSLTPEELISGKALGLMTVSLSQLLVWSLTIVVGLIVGARFVEQLQGISVPWALLGIIALFFLPSFALVAGMMTSIGSAVTETQQGQQISGVINLLFVAPFFFLALILANPDSPVVIALTLFPTTAFITVTMRWGLTVIPLWQLVLSWLLLVGSAGLSVWAAARILRAGMLRYGQRLSLRAMMQAVRAGGID